ncbi:MAG: hypothetical protein AB7U29_17765, partial [Desulfobulbus sp.]
IFLCPPHPLLAGNMENNVVQEVAKTMASHMPVLLFNYPAVGKSTSPQPGLPLFEVWNALDQHKDYRGIVEEVRQVIGWSRKYFCRYHMVGYSFGAHMALTALTPEALSYTAIAPPLAEENFSALSTLSLPICLIMAEEDNLLTAQIPESCPTHVKNLEIQGGDHFFRGREQEVAKQVMLFVTN